MSHARSFVLVQLCFLLSGFAALIYQTAWTREFAFVFGTSELAVATVLAAYMGGLAAGSAVGGRLAYRVRRPVMAYAVLEAGIAIAALAVPFAIRAATALYVRVLGGRPDLADAGGTPATLYFLASSFAILAVPTALMGATLPLLIRHVIRTSEELGRRVGRLYALNTAGAVAGTVVTGFVLLSMLGLRGTVWVAVGVNALVFVLAAWTSRATQEAPPLPAEAPPEEGTSAPRPGARWILPAMFLSGALSFSYEVLWTRLLAHLLGGSVHAFAVMLGTFLTGIALGSAVAARRATEPRRAARLFALAQIGTGLLSVLAYHLLDALPGLAQGLQGLGGRLVADALVSALLLLPSTLCIGATFPLAVRILARDAEDASAATARTYAWNTVGGTMGAVAAGFWLVPALGFEGSLGAAVLGNLLLAGIALWTLRPTADADGARWRPAPAVLVGACAVAIAFGLFWPTSPPWNLLRTAAIEREVTSGQPVFYEVGRSATVLVLEKGSGWQLRTNGLPEATIQGDHGRPGVLTSPRWMGLLPSLARPDAEEILVVGLGGGVALEMVPATVRRIDVVELEPEVVAANRAVGPQRLHDPLADPRVHLHVNDARAALHLTEQRFDAIVSQPSHPWTAGASHLYTREFFQLVRDRLEPGGVLVQWMGLAFADAELLRSLVATLLETFEHVRVYRPSGASAVYFLASNAPLDLVRSSERTLARQPELFARLGLFRAEDVEAALLLDEQGARRFAAGAPVNTDDDNLLQTRSPRLLAEPPDAGHHARAFARYEPFLPPPPELDPVELVASMVERGQGLRAPAIVGTLPTGAPQQLARGIVAQAQGDPVGAAQAFEGVLRADPGHPVARARLLRLRSTSVARGNDALLERLAPLRPGEQALVEAWRTGRAEGPAAVRPLEDELAAVGIGDPLAFEALRERARWRVAAGGPARGAEALHLLDRAIAGQADAELLLLRSRAALEVGDAGEALEAIEQLLPWMEGSPQPPPETTRALELVRTIEAPPHESWRRALESRLERILGPRTAAQQVAR